LAKSIQALFRDISNNKKNSKGRKIRPYFTDKKIGFFIPSNIEEGYGRKTTMDYIRMLYISYGLVFELETQV